MKHSLLTTAVIFAALAGLLILGLHTADILGIGAGPVSDMGDQVCTDTFGESYEYAGYLLTNPPEVHCAGPGGVRGVTTMPRGMADQLGIRATAYRSE